MSAGRTDVSALSERGVNAKPYAAELRVGRNRFDRARCGVGAKPAGVASSKHPVATCSGYSARSLLIPLAGDTGFGKILLGALVLSVGAAIGYALWRVLDYVQNWSVVNAWVSRIILSQ
ncbi:MAG: hypothetical protein N2379_02730 [Verrucomicrobiae bacterium]|nr:hypothetical protein [Verrucomicrobiae bacterium]